MSATPSPRAVRDVERGGERAPSASSAPAPQARRSPETGARGADNLALQSLHKHGALRAKLVVGGTDDPAEVEADRIAAHALGGGPRGALSPSAGRQAPKADDVVSRKAAGPPSRAPVAPDGDLGLGSGRPIGKPERDFFESRMGGDFSNVRVHDDAHANHAADQLDARAFTVGTDIAFARGEFSPNSHDGRQLLAHELAHVMQNDNVVRREPKPPTGPDAKQPPSGRAGSGSGGPVVVPPAGQPAAGPTGPQPAVPLDAKSKEALAKSGLLASDEEQSELAQGFPGGFIVGQPTPAVLSLDFGTRLDSARGQVFQLTPVNTPTPGVEAWFFQLGKGRSVLVSSVGGGSVLLDVGTGNSNNPNSRSVQRLSAAIGAITAGQAEVPLTIKVSHADQDHYNGVRAVLTRAAFANTAVEVTRQQIEGAGNWTRTSLTVQPTQRLIEVGVTGADGVHIQRTVIDNMELTEFRSVAAHDDLGRTDKVTFNQNRTSPVVVVRDLNTGNRMLFTSDAEGRQFDEIVNAVGDSGMRRLLGAEGRNLKVMEAPHHFGEQTGPNARGMINMLQLAYESGDGSIRLVAQTTPNFAAKVSSTYNFLDASGTAPERIERDPSGRGQAQVTRARGSALSRVTVDMTGVEQAIQELRSRDTPLRQAYARLTELDASHSRLSAMREGLGETAPPAVTAALSASEADVVRLRAELTTSTQAVWDAMRAAAAPEGMRNTADMTAVNAALASVATNVANSEAETNRVGSGIASLAEGMSTYAKLSTNSVRIINALETDNVSELYAARAEHNDLVRAARAGLGSSVVDENIRAAWTAVQAEWPVERFEARTAEMSSRVAARERNAEFRATLGIGLARQNELNNIVAQAEHSGRQVYGPNGVPMTPTSTRVGAGIMAAIEVVRIGLDIYGQWKAGSEASELRQARTAYQGIAIMNWWQRLGVTPHLALAKQGTWDESELKVVMREPQDKVREAATSDEPPKEVPDFTAVVVNGLDPDGLRKLIHRAIAELSTLEDWHTFNTGFPGGEAFHMFEGFVWGARVFHEESGRYSYMAVDEIAPGLNLEIIRLYGALVQAQENAFDADKKEGKAGYGVKDTAWVFGQDRRVVIYSRAGVPQTIDFDSDRPRFQKLATISQPWRIDGAMVKVQAEDMMTYDKLVDFYWAEDSGTPGMDSSGGPTSTANVSRNVHGFAYVNPNHLIERDD